jgi:hypothetical protein
MNLLDCHGKDFSAVIADDYCEGKIAVNGNEVFLCQNTKNGAVFKDKLGFKKSWFIGRDGGDNPTMLKNFFQVENLTIGKRPQSAFVFSYSQIIDFAEYLQSIRGSENINKQVEYVEKSTSDVFDEWFSKQ